MSALNDTFCPALIEKGHLNLLNTYYEEAEENLLQVLQIENNNIMAR